MIFSSDFTFKKTFCYTVKTYFEKQNNKNQPTKQNHFKTTQTEQNTKVFIPGDMRSDNSDSMNERICPWDPCGDKQRVQSSILIN